MTKVKYEGFIQEITNDVAYCRFFNEEEDEELLMEVPLSEFTKKDLKDLKEGYYLHYECTYKLTVDREKWTEEEIETAKKKGKEMSDFLQGK